MGDSQHPKQARWWLLTIPAGDWEPPAELPAGVTHMAGQQEQGASGYLHWQLVASFKRAVRLCAVKNVFGRTAHAEPARSDAARAYCAKKDTAVEGTRFELGQLPFRRNSQPDWAIVRQAAVADRLEEVPDDIFVRYYGNLRKIAADHAQPTGVVRDVSVFWGSTGTGKTRRAWEEAGIDAYAKDPRSKFWCGYRGQQCVIIDEFRGGIDVGHLLRWLDRYPVRVETKGGSVPLRASKLWITSNLSPEDWYPELDEETKKAVRRRLTKVIHFNEPL